MPTHANLVEEAYAAWLFSCVFFSVERPEPLVTLSGRLFFTQLEITSFMPGIVRKTGFSSSLCRR